MPDWSELVQEFRFELGLFLVGVVLVTYGVYVWTQKTNEGDVLISVSQPVDNNENKKIVVDVGGEVVKPGVYELEVGQRIGEALDIAGGLTANADKDGVSLSLNKAERLRDGQKIYIPAKNSNSNSGNHSYGLISINTAGVSDLESLPGIGVVTAEKIIKSRPYTSLEQLKSKGVLGDKQFEGLTGLISL